jgi:DNA-binding beta-propeller fold protein YncE
MKRAIVIAVAACAAGFAIRGQAAAPARPGYHLSKKIPLPGAASYWDYLFVDDAARRLYVSFGGDVVVVDADAGTVLSTLSGRKRVHGVAVAPGGRLFVTDGEAGAVAVYDGKTGKSVGEVKAGENPDAILYDPASKQIFAFNHSGGTATIIDPATLKVTATLEIGGKLEFGRADGKGNVWVNAEDRSQTIWIDSHKRAVKARWALAPCQEPTGLAFDARNRRLFVGCNNEMMAVLDADSGKVITTLPIGPGVDATDFDPATGNIFNSCGGGEGSLVVLHQDGPDKYSPVENIATQRRARTLAVDHKTHRVFLSGASFAPPAAATAANPKPRPAMIPGSFGVLVFEK